MFAKDIGIDLGTATVLIYVKGKGVVLREPSVVSIDRDTGRVLKVGQEALDMLKPNPAMMHNIYGSMAMARNRLEMFKEAIEYYELSYRYNPKNISALSSIGYCYERMKDYMKALEYYERYLKVGKPGSRGYEFVEESIEYVKQELFMEEGL